VRPLNLPVAYPLVQRAAELHQIPQSTGVELPPRLARSVPKRVREYTAGRYLARQALTSLGVSGEVGANEDRSPLWPAGIVGSISHTDQRAWVALARAEDVASIGIDVEESITEKTARSIAARIFDGQEQALLESRGLGFCQALTIAFSVKESLYKCQYPLFRTWLGFGDVKLKAATEHTVQLEVSKLDVSAVEVIYELRENYVCSAAILPLSAGFAGIS